MSRVFVLQHGTSRCDLSERVNSQTTRTATGTLSSDVEIDLWRRLRDSAKASELDANARRADYEGARISLIANVIRQVLSILFADKIIALEEQRLETLVLKKNSSVTVILRVSVPCRTWKRRGRNLPGGARSSTRGESRGPPTTGRCRRCWASMGKR